jgi:valyl-tRNA synthetase
MPELSKIYDPRAVEARWYEFWSERGFFVADETRPGPRFSIVIPPPNVTGMLTMGHVLNNTLQDILVRYQRMNGKITLWMPGTDHAGIATQNVVEKALAKEGLDRHRLGREEFVSRVWAWKERYGATILLQLRRLGASCDWRRECFTMDPALSRAVREVFVRLYEEKLIYRGHRIIHWCPRCHTALSDEEAITTEGGEPGNLWHLRYPAEDGGPGVVVATTRPETMLGDTGIAVHPDDHRYHGLLGRRVILPLMNRPIPVVADAVVDPAFGSGAVKVTPAHDANDFEIANRNGLEPICIMTVDGRINENGGAYRGLDRFEARKRIVADLELQGLLVKSEPYQVPIRRCERCDTVIEPYLSDQWFVRMQPLAVPAIEAIKSGRLRFFPDRWVGVYLHWMESIRDWCISRQLWWGHRIPVWYCDDCPQLTVAREDPARCRHCGSERIRQDEDVLDTWFSSWLWPFSTMGWPDDTPALRRFYPTDALVTGADIIFFWVARMVMAGYHFLGDCPFQDVYFNSIVRDTQRRKMSKSLGNSPDPLDLIDTYGADALRFTIVSLAPLGEDVIFANEKTELGRNFANKIWNAARFCLMNLGDQETPALADVERTDRDLPQRWILSRLQSVVGEVRASVDGYRFNEAATTLYRFVWGEFCDWFVELSKLSLYGADAASQQRARATLLRVLERICRLLHPYMPFVTEEIWQALPLRKEAESVMVSEYPRPDDSLRDVEAERTIGNLIELVRAVRNIRSELGVLPNAEVTARIALKGDPAAFAGCEVYLRALARVRDVELLGSANRPVDEPSAVVDGVGEVFVPLRGAVDFAEVRKRLENELGKIAKELRSVEAKLARPDFVAKAPPDIVGKEQARAQALRERRGTLTRHLEVLQAGSQ